MYPISTNLSTLGSRYTLIFDIAAKRLKHGVLGMFLEQSDQLICGVESEGISGSYLPFSDLPNHFQAFYQTLEMNSVSYRAVNKEGGYDISITFTSPFCPENEKMNTAPIFYTDIEISRNSRPHSLVCVRKNIEKGMLRFGLQGSNLNAAPKDNICDFTYEVETSSRFVLGDFARTLHLKLYRDGTEVKTVPCTERLINKDGHCGKDGIFEIPFILSDEPFHTQFVLCGYCDIRDFISVNGTLHNLLYTSYFDCIDDLMDYALDTVEDNMRQTAFVNSAISKSSLSQSWKDFISFTFQSYKMNTVWSYNNQGKKAYHVWEGNCMYNSTMDVEYNNGLFYYTFFPEVLPTLFEQWAASENGKGYIAHDQGEAYSISNAKYSYPMIVEENCCYLLMLHTYCIYRGSWETAASHYEVKRLADRILNADTTGNGIPDTGTDNTIDDAIPAIQNAREQTYLALKSACALGCFAEIAQNLGHTDEAKTALSRSRQIMVSVDKELWLGDHYGVCTDTSQNGYRRFLTHEILSGPMEGKDSYSIYAENGLLYPFLSGTAMPYLNTDRLKQNIAVSNEICSTEFGCKHSHDSGSVWFSQNMWRDFTASYLGHDMLDNVDRYWEFQKIMNTGENLNLYIDTFGENALWYYPRGLTSVGVLNASLRLQINNFTHELHISPLRQSMRIPLVFLTDWKKLQMPWVTVNDGRITIENSQMLHGYKIILQEWQIHESQIN